MRTRGETYRLMTAPTDCDYLFVYGTLRRGGRSDMHRLLAASARYVGLGSVQGELYLVSTYPGLVPSSDASARVRGELYQLVEAQGPRNALLDGLDRYEDYNPRSPETSLYIRECRNVEIEEESGGTRAVAAWVYRFNRSTTTLRRILSGDFFDR